MLDIYKYSFICHNFRRYIKLLGLSTEWNENELKQNLMATPQSKTRKHSNLETEHNIRRKKRNVQPEERANIKDAKTSVRDNKYTDETEYTWCRPPIQFSKKCSCIFRKINMFYTLGRCSPFSVWTPFLFAIVYIKQNINVLEGLHDKWSPSFKLNVLN